MPKPISKSRRPPALVVVMWLMSAMFIGILIFTYVVTKRANPIFLDEHGRPVNQQSSASTSKHQ
jgi:hypothetical protein